MQVLLTAASFEASPCDQASAEASSLLARSPTGRARPDASIGLSGIPPDSRESASVADGGLSEASPCDQAPAGASSSRLDRLRVQRTPKRIGRPSGIPSDSRESASVADGGLSEASPCDQAPAGASRFPAGSPTSGAHPINASRNCASFGADRRIRERGAPHLTVKATPLSSGPRRGAPRSVELRCEAFVFFPSVDFYSRPREMRSGELPRLRPPRVESWRARRGGLEGAGKSWGGVAQT